MSWIDRNETKIAVAIAICVSILLVGFYKDFHKNQPNKQEIHIQSVNKMHEALHEGEAPHPWLHALPQPKIKRKGRAM